MVDEKALQAACDAADQQLVREDGPAAYRPSVAVIEAAITAYLQALSPGSTGETEGWVLVPKEPNSAQLDRAVAFALNVSLGGDYRWTDYMRDLYGRFLSAAGERG